MSFKQVREVQIQDWQRRRYMSGVNRSENLNAWQIFTFTQFVFFPVIHASHSGGQVFRPTKHKYQESLWGSSPPLQKDLFIGWGRLSLQHRALPGFCFNPLILAVFTLTASPATVKEYLMYFKNTCHLFVAWHSCHNSMHAGSRPRLFSVCSLSVRLSVQLSCESFSQ